MKRCPLLSLAATGGVKGVRKFRVRGCQRLRWQKRITDDKERRGKSYLQCTACSVVKEARDRERTETRSGPSRGARRKMGREGSRRLGVGIPQGQGWHTPQGRWGSNTKKRPAGFLGQLASQLGFGEITEYIQILYLSSLCV